MKRFVVFIDAVNERIGKFACFLMVPLIIVVTYEVVVRYAFNSPTIWAHESSGFAFLLLVVLGGAWVLHEGGHIRVDVLYSRFSPYKKAIADMFTSTVFFVFTITLLWKGIGFAWRSVAIQETSNTVFAPPLWPFKIAIVLAASLLVLQGIAEFTRSLIFVLKERRSK